MDSLTRRRFFGLAYRGLAAVGLAGVVAPAAAYFYPAGLKEAPSQPVPAGDIAALPVGDSKVVGYGRYPAIVVHTPRGLRAFSAVCTHFACVVYYDADGDRLVCPCHEALFDSDDGHVIDGPAPRGLQELPVGVVDGVVIVGGEA